MPALLMNCLAGICSSISRMFRIDQSDEDYGGHADTELYFYILEVIRHGRRERRGHELMQRFMEVMMEAQEGFVYGDDDDECYSKGGGMDGDHEVVLEDNNNKNGDMDEGGCSKRRKRRRKECAICLEELEEGEICKAVEGCRHVFHKQCLVSWLIRNKTCPICRAAAALSVPSFHINQLWDQVLAVDSS